MIKHSEGWNVDRCSLWMEKSGTAHDWCYPASGNEFPNLEDYDGVMVFGGAPSANDTDQLWIRKELAYIESCLKADKPFFGICLGAQMLARVLGAEVTKPEDERAEIGFCEVKPTTQGQHFMPGPLKVMQWHREGFDLPTGATRLAYNEVFENQAYSLGDHIIGVQFHPEVNLDVLRIWHERNKTRTTGVLNDETRAVHLADAQVCEQPITDWLDSFLTSWTHRAAKAA